MIFFLKQQIVDFLKAVIKKQVWVAGYINHHGTYVRPHFSVVNASPDHDDHTVATGQSKKKYEQDAHKHLSKQADHNALSTEHQAGNVLHLATHMQKEASQKSDVSTLKKKIIAGKSPTNGEWKSFLSASDEQKKSIIAAVNDAGKYDLFSQLLKEHVDKHGIQDFTKPEVHSDSETVDEKPDTENLPAKKEKSEQSDGIDYDSELNNIANLPAGNNKKKAHDELSKHADWGKWSSKEKHDKVKTLYAEKQTADNASSNISKFKKALKSGKSPSATLIEAFKALPEEKQKAIIADLGGEDVVRKYIANVKSDAKVDVTEPAKQPAESSHSALKVKTFTHSQKGHTVYSVPLPQKLCDADYKAVASLAKQAGGFYSSFKKDGAIPGFYFKSHEKAQEFAQQAGEAYNAIDANGYGAVSAMIADKKLSGKGPEVVAGTSNDAPIGTHANLMDVEYQKESFGWFDPKTQKTIDSNSMVGAALEILSGHSPSDDFLNSADSAKKEASIEVAIEDGHVDLNSNPNFITDALGQMFPAGENGPKDGDIKTINGVQYILQSGRWHKVDTDEPVTSLSALLVPDGLSETTQQKLALTKDSLAQNHANLSVSIGKYKITISDKNGGWKQQFYNPVKYSNIGNEKLYKILQFLLSGKNLAGGSVKPEIMEAMEKAGYPIAETAGGKKKATKKNPVEQKILFTKPGQTISADSLKSGAFQSIDDWVEKPNTQKGSNPGGEFVDGDGNKWYVKFPKTEDHAKNEQLAAKLYEAMGIPVPALTIVKKGDKIGVASKWIDGLSKVGPDIRAQDGATSGFAADAWLANHDSVGTGYDNMLKDANGNAVRVDVGGSLLYRAQGDKKAGFGNEVTELHTMLDPSKNLYSAKVFGGMTISDIEDSVGKVLMVSDDKIKALVNKYGPGTIEARKELADKLIARKESMKSMYPEALDKALQAKKEAAKASFNPSNISTPPNFEDFYGDTGNGYKSGGPLSSHAFINESNNAAVSQIFELAKHGDLDALKDMKVPVFDKDSEHKGGIKEWVPAGQHPSKHVRAYYSNCLSEVDLQLNPPEMPSLGLIESASAFDIIGQHFSAVPPGKAVAAVDKAQKAGKYIVLGKVSDFLSLDAPDENDSVIASESWKDAAKKHYAAADQKAKDTFNVYVSSSGAKALNTALRNGSMSESVYGKTISDHLNDFKQLLVDIPEGSTFIRNMGEKGYGQAPDSKDIKELQQFLLSTGPGTVVQEPGFTSTSWSGGNKILSNNDIQWRFTAGKDVKMFPAWLTANSGVGVGLLPPNARYVIRGANKVGKTVVVDAYILPTED